MKFALVLPFTYTDPLTYSVPTYLEKVISVGQAVKIPLGKQIIKGIVLDLQIKKPPFKTRKITEIINVTPMLTKNQISLAYWLSSFYFSSLYRAFKNIALEGIENQAEENIQCTENAKNNQKGSENKKLILFGKNFQNISLKIASKFLDNAEQVLILFPDNASLEKYARNVRHKLKEEEISTISSKMTKKERIKEWFNIKNGRSKLILGTRTAIFSPFCNLGLIIINKEYEDGLIQEKTPRYHTTEVAEYLQKLLKITLILHTDIPTLQNTYRLQHGYKKIKNKVDVVSRQIKTVDSDDKFSVLGEEVEQMIKENLRNKKRAVLFLNRKGKETFVICNDCGTSPKCPSCNVPLIATSRYLMCNHCGFKKETSLKCLNCQSTVVRKLGMGTEKLEEEIKNIFPETKTLRIDENAQQNFTKKQLDTTEIIIGTQMVKNISFADVSLVVIFSTDNMLNLSTYKAAENTQKILSSLIAKTKQGTKIIIKTSDPKNPLIHAIKNQDYEGFFRDELKSFKRLKYPPFYDLIQIIMTDKNEDKLMAESRRLKKHFQKYDVLGPFTPFVSKKGGKNRKLLIIKTNKNTLFYDKILKSTKNLTIIRNPENII